MTTAERIRRHTGPALFSFGFRPFYLAAAFWAALAVPVWVASFTLGDGTIGGLDGRAWHVHEMLFGYLAGVVAGFLLTAVPNWTGRLPVTGWSLGGLFALWAAGRLAGFAPPAFAVPAAILDSAFLIVFAAVIWREVLAAGNRRNLPVCLLVSLLACANVAFHLQGLAPSVGPFAQRAAVAVICGLIALVGGRVTPSFTTNWTNARNLSPGPTPFNRFDQLALGLTGLALAGWVAAPDRPEVGALLLVAGGASLGRVIRWRGWKAAAEPLVWILHLGYLWLAIGLSLLGAAALAPDLFPATAGLHGLTAGAMGVMTLAMMTRSTLGHTGQPRVADRWTLWLYLAVNLGACLRVAAPFATNLTPQLLGLAAAAWSIAFGLFVVRYGPMLVRRSPG
jgi:uncharacterized protein involved in response to NO